MRKVIAIIVAAGKGKRMGADTGKQWISLQGKPIIAHTLQRFEECSAVDSIIVVTQSDEIEYCRNEVIERFGFTKVIGIIKGGKERQDSVRNGLDAVDDSYTIVIIHDGVRPFVSPSIINRSIESAEKTGASVVSVPVKDTIKEVSDGYVVKTLKRGRLWAVQTPQTFKTEIIKHAHKKALEDGIYATDDSSLVERLGFRVEVVEGSYENIKITTPEDLIIGEAIANRFWIRCS
ncbi:MAG: 2-C-methyl-D-erythritol 4-phosphate cytidylyltransferase [Deltaproteobacteria bacterium]|nr:2-C-methyl-D-erythritol 4-phosphate cytidylyltransferase [Deltaproteobacteria bacterium]